MKGEGITWTQQPSSAARKTIGLRTRLQRVVREPLLQFMALGACFFVLAHVVEVHRQSADRTILIDDSVIRRLSRLYEMQMGSLPSPERINGMVDDYVHDEVMYREAVKAGLDQDDEIVRRRMIQKLEFLDRDLATVTEPADDQLHAFYDSHRSLFVSPAKVSFRHVYFSPDRDGSEGARQRAAAELAQMQGLDAQGGLNAGDRFPLQYDYASLGRIDTVQIFGQTGIVDSLFAAPIGRWIGPVQSGYGWHLVYIQSRADEQLQAFDAVHSRVHDAWLEQARQDSNRRQFEAMLGRYTVVRADKPGRAQ